MGLFTTTPDGRVTWTNERFGEIWGMDGPIGRDWLDLVHPADRRRLLADVERGVAARGRFGTHCRILRGDRDVRWVRVHLAPVDGSPEWTGTIEDVTAEVGTLTALAEREAEFRLLAEHSSDLLARHHPDGSLRYVSPAATTLLGWDPDELVGHSPWALGIVGRDVEHQFAEAFRTAEQEGSTQRLSYRARHRTGRFMWIETSLRVVPGTDGGIISVSRDVSERHAAEAELQHQALHDALTGLPNRALFRDRLDHALAAARRDGSCTAVVFLDLDRFKVVNDSLGHAAGDELLVAVARRLSAVLRERDTLARFGGDELTVLLEDVGGEDAARDAVARMREALHEPFALGRAGDVALRASFGVALAAHGNAAPDVLLRDADAAMYRAKAQGRDRVAFFDADMRAEAQERMAVEQALRPAIGRGELRLHFQPVVALASGRVTGFEALVRWQHPTRGPLPPQAFVPIAEEAGIVCDLGDWVLDAALDQLAEWRLIDPDVRIGINAAAAQFAQPDFATRVVEGLAVRGLPGRSLVIEITERAVADQDPAVVRRLRDADVSVVLDDFGTGWSSLVHLRRFAFDGLKVDRSFVDGLGRNEEDEAIVRAVCSLGAALGLSVVAEGVENHVQLERLVGLGCETAQGYGFAHPFPGPEATRLVGTSLTLR